MQPVRTFGLERYRGIASGHDGKFTKWRASVYEIIKPYRDYTRG